MSDPNDAELWYTLFNESNDIVLLFDCGTFHLRKANPAAQRVTGFDMDELASLKLSQILEAEDKGGIDGIVQAFQTTGIFHSREGFRLRRKNVGWIPVNISVSRVHTRPEPLGLVVVRNISERRAMQDQLAASRASFSSIVDKCADGILVVDAAGLVQFANPIAGSFLGSESDRLVGRALGFPIRTRSAMDLDIVRPGGARGVAEVRAQPTIWMQRPAHLVLLCDVTELRQTEAQLRQAQKMDAIGQLAGGISHEFNNALQGIMGYAQLLLDVETDASKRSDLTHIQTVAKRASDLTRQLLAFARRQTLEPVVLNLHTLVESTMKMLRRVLADRVELCVQTVPDLGNVRADRSQIEQVLVNLALNAEAAMPAGGTLTIATANVVLGSNHFTTDAIEAGPHVRLSVADTGVGMDAQTKQRIFEPFFTTKEVGQGTGLGLATVYGIVKQHGGHIGCDSEPGNGTRFQIYLPRVPGPVHDWKAEVDSDSGPRGAEAVLVVDDEEFVCDVVERILRSRGYSVFVALTAPAAESLFQEHAHEIALLLTDVVMPGTSGHDLFERLSQKNPRLKVLYMSGYTKDALYHEGVIQPGTMLLHKPFSAAALTTTVRERLDT